MAAEEVMDWAGLLLRESAPYLKSRPYLEVTSESGQLLHKNKHLNEKGKRTN
jgi:hypothetical protein